MLCFAAFLPAVTDPLSPTRRFLLPPPLLRFFFIFLCFNSRGALSTLVILPLMAATCQPLISGSSSHGSSHGQRQRHQRQRQRQQQRLQLRRRLLPGCVCSLCSLCRHSFIRGHGTYIQQTQQDEPLGGATVPAWRRRQA